MAFLFSLDNNGGAQISNLVMDHCFNGSNIVVEHRRSQDDFFLVSVERI